MKTDLHFEFEAMLWLYQGKAAWHFITLPAELSEQIRFFTSGNKTAWGSVRVSVTIGDTKWNTSIFPDSKLGSYGLPVKAAVRKAQNIQVGDVVSVRLDVVL